MTTLASACGLVLAGGPAPAFFGEVAAVVVVGALIAYACNRVGLPPIVGFLVTGVAIGPNALGLVYEPELVDSLAELGVILLLFTIGIEFSLERLTRIRGLILGGGGLQVGLVTAAVAACVVAAGAGWRTAVFSGFLVALSSTAIVMKLLGDRAETRSPRGQASVGVLIFQDLAIIPMVLLVPMLGSGGGSALDVVLALAKAAGIVVAVLFVARRGMPVVLERVARTCSPELFLLTVVAICFGTAWLTSLAGLSLSLGAFLAGLVVSESRYSNHALAEILPLQILFNAAFFISVGMLLDLGYLLSHLPLVVGAVLGILALKTLATAGGLCALRMRPRRALAVGVGLAQVGEFSFVLARVGREYELLPFGVEGGGQVLVASSVLLMALTPGLLALAARIDSREDGARAEPEAGPGELAHGALPALENHVVVAGYGQAAHRLVHVLEGSGVPFVVVTLSPAGAKEAEGRGDLVLLGDPMRLHTLELASIARAKVLVVPDDEPSAAHRIVSVARTRNATMHVVVRTRSQADVPELLAAGADAVVAEELEVVVGLFAQVLDHFPVSDGAVARHEATVRRAGYAAIADAGSAAPIAVACEVAPDGVDCRRVRVRAESPVAGAPLDALDLEGRFGLEPVAVWRGGTAVWTRTGDGANPGDASRPPVLAAGDRLELRGSAEAFAAAQDLFLPPATGDAGPSPGASGDPSGAGGEAVGARPGDERGAPGGGMLLAAARGSAEGAAGTRAAVDTQAAVALAVRGDARCAHAAGLGPVVPRAAGCEECLAAGRSWVHLRLCMACGHVGCCDDSEGRHASAHWRRTGHPVARSLEPGESWAWCFEDEVLLEG